LKVQTNGLDGEAIGFSIKAIGFPVQAGGLMVESLGCTVQTAGFPIEAAGLDRQRVGFSTHFSFSILRVDVGRCALEAGSKEYFREEAWGLKRMFHLRLRQTVQDCE
jgi:hypothetical protein